MHYCREGLREEIRRALLILPRTRGQLDGFEDTSCRPAFATKPKRNVAEDGGQQFVDADPVRTLACKSFKRTTPPLPDDAFRSAKLVRAVNHSPAPCNDWLTYCYSDGPGLPTRILMLTVLERFKAKEPKAMQAKSFELLKKLVLLACQQKRDELNAARELLTQTYIAELSGKKLPDWKKNWAPRWNRLLAILDAIDNEGLDYVYEYERGRKVATRNSHLFVQRCRPFATRAAVVA